MTPTFGTSDERPRGVHLVGSVPLANAREVFTTVSGVLGRHLLTLPDGETGKRLVWNSWTRESFYETPGFEIFDPPEGHYTPWNQVRLTVDPADLVLRRLGFADAATSSYEVFAALKRDGVIPEHVRFQVCLPTPIAPMMTLVEEGSRADVEVAQSRQLRSEIREILAAVPHDQLAFQWDVCFEVGMWEGVFSAWFDEPRRGIIDRLEDLSREIPADVDLGFHLCYGDFGHKHYKEPEDAGTLVEMSNAICAAVDRPVTWIHVPVPRSRGDEAYFEPFGELRLQPGTRYYLGLLHNTDGVEGAERRLRTARRWMRGFGVATECGFGRRRPETVDQLLRLHADVAAEITKQDRGG